MKLASYKDGSRDGQLLVVSRDLTMAHYATGIASRLQQVLDDWNFLSPQLQELSQSVNHGKARHAFAFEPKLCMAPLPRISYLALADPSADSSPGTAEASGPMVRLARSDDLLGACDRIPLRRQASADADADAVAEASLDGADGEPGLAFTPRLAMITGDIQEQTEAQDSLEAIRLICLASSWHLHGRHLQAIDSALTSSFSPVAVTLDELGSAWKNGRIQLGLKIGRNGRAAGRGDGAASLHFGEVLAQCAAQRGLRAGSMIAVAIPGSDGFDSAMTRLTAADSLQLDITGVDGQSLFGAIATARQAAAD